MPDNTVLNLGSAGDTIRDVNRAGVKTQVVLLDVGGTAGEHLIGDSTYTLPVSGTITANAGSGTLAVSAASLPLPAGAATAAKQPALGTAGTASADVLSIQGIASMTAIKVDGSAVTQPVSGTVTANAGTGTFTVGGDAASGGADSGNPVKVGGVYSTALPTLTTGNRADLHVNVNGRLLVDGSGVTQPVSGTFWQATQPVSGTFWQATQPVSGTVAATQSGTWTVQPGNTANSTAWLVTGTGGTFPATQSGTWNVGTVTTVTTVSAVTAISNALPAGANVIGAVEKSGDLINIGGTTYTVKRAYVDASSSGNTQVVALVSAKKLRVLAYSVGPVSAAVNVYFRSSTAGQISPTKCFAANGGMARGVNEFGHFETTAGEALQVNLSGAITVAGISVLYIEV